MNEHEELEDFGWEDNQAYSEMICEGFSTDEIEALEACSDFYFPLLERTGKVTFSEGAPLALEQVWEFRGGDNDEQA